MPGIAVTCRAEAKIGFARRGCALFATLLVAMPVSAACSSPARPGFGPGYRATIGHYRAEFDALKKQAQAAIGTGLDSQLAVFVRMTDVTDATVKDLRRLSPPARVKPAFARLINTMSSQAAALRQIQHSARDGDQASLDASLHAYATALENGASLQRQVEVAVGRTTTHS